MISLDEVWILSNKILIYYRFLDEFYFVKKTIVLSCLTPAQLNFAKDETDCSKFLCKNFTVKFCKRKSLNQLSKVLIKSTLLLKVSTQVLKISFNKKRTAVMASHIKTQLTQISTSAGGTHRDLADKYKVVLEAILKLGEQDNLF